MKKVKTVISARREKVRIHDPLAALIARMCDPTDPIYDENVTKSFENQDGLLDNRS